MAFDIRNLSEVRALGNGRWHWHYFTTDSLATCLAADYFSTTNGLSRLHRGDVLEIVASTAAESQQVTISSVANSSVTLLQSSAGAATDATARAAAVAAQAKADAALPSAGLATATFDFTAGATGGVARTTTAKGGEALSVQDFGAVGNGSTDNTAAIQAGIDYLAGLGGGELIFPAGNYVIATPLVLKAGVTLKGVVRGGTPDTNLPAKLTAKPGGGFTGAWMVDTPATSTTGAWVVGLKFVGRPAGTVLGGVRVQFGIKCGVSNCFFDTFGEQAILDAGGGGNSNSYKNNFAQNTLLNRSRAAVCGAIEVHSNDSWIEGGEYTTSSTANNGLNSYATETGTAQAGGASTITLRSGARAVNNCYLGRITITSGTGSGQTRYVSSYVGATKVLTVTAAWATNPDATSVYAIYGPLADTAQAGGATSITLSANESANDSEFCGFLVEITSGTGSGLTNVVTAYVGSTKVATVLVTWATNPDATSVYKLYPIRCAALAMYGSNCGVRGMVVCETSDCGVYAQSSASPGDRYSTVRADLNAGPGFVVAAQAKFTGCDAWNNGQNGNGLYDGWLDLGGAQAAWIGCGSGSAGGSSSMQRYGFNHTYAPGNTTRGHNHCPHVIGSHSSGLVNVNSTLGATVTMPPGSFYQHASGTTLALDGVAGARISGSSLTINDASGTYEGGIYYIWAQNDTTIAHNTGTNIKFQHVDSNSVVVRANTGVWFLRFASSLRLLGKPPQLPRYTTAGRPTAASVGAGWAYFDTTVSKPAWSTGAAYVDGAGTAV